MYDVDGLCAEATMVKHHEFTSYRIIHPNHAERVNVVFQPDEEIMAWCRDLVKPMENAQV